MFSSRKKKKSLRLEALDPRLMMTADIGLLPITELGEPFEFVAVTGIAPYTRQVDDTLVITGDIHGSDDFKLALGTEEHVLTIGGRDYVYDASIVRNFEIDMNFYRSPNWNTDATDAGEINSAMTDSAMVELLLDDSFFQSRDRLTIIGSELDDRLEVTDNELTLVSSSYKVEVTRGAWLTRVSGGGGDDSAKFNDTEGNDQFFMHPTFTTYVAPNSFGNQDATIKASGFEKVRAIAERGYDRVNFYDSERDDRFVGKQKFSYMNGDGFSNYAEGFDRVDAHHRFGGTDEAILYDSAGDDVFLAEPRLTQLRMKQSKHLVTHNYAVTRAFASEGNDIASLRGELFTEDVFVWEPTSAFMHSTGNDTAPQIDRTFPAVQATNFAAGFDVVRANADNDSRDRAELRGSEGDDALWAGPSHAKLNASNGSEVVAANFAIVRAHGRGGFDKAELTNGLHSDRYVSNDRFVYMAGRNAGGVTGSIPPSFFAGPAYLNYVEDFDQIDVRFMRGGAANVHMSEYGKAADELMVIDGSELLLLREDRDEAVTGLGRGDAATLVGDNAGLYVENPAAFEVTMIGHTERDISDEERQAIKERLRDLPLILELTPDLDPGFIV